MNRLEDTVKAFESRRSWNFSKKGRQLHEEIIRRIEYLEVLAKESPTVLSRINGLQDRVKDAIHSRTRRRLSAAVIAALLMFVSGMNAWNYHKDTRALSEIADLPESVTPATPFEMPTTSEDRERLQVYRTTRQQIGDRLATAQVCYAHYRPFSWTKIGSQNLFLLWVDAADERIKKLEHRQDELGKELKRIDGLISAWDAQKTEKEAKLTAMNDEAKAIADDIKPTSSEADLKRARIRLDNFASQKDFPVDRKTLVENLRTLDAAQARRFGASGPTAEFATSFLRGV